MQKDLAPAPLWRSWGAGNWARLIADLAPG